MEDKLCKALMLSQSATERYGEAFLFKGPRKGGIEMDRGKFVLAGEDKKVLAGIKNALTTNGYIYTGYSQEPFNILRLIRRHTPDLVIVDTGGNFCQIRQIVSVLDEELLAACILVLEKRSDEIIDYLLKTRIISYINKPVFDENMLQITDISMVNYRRVLEYEHKVKQLNDTLETRKIVEKAKWALVEQKCMTEDEAYEWIRKKSRDSRVTMKSIAEAIMLTKGL